MLLLLPGAAAAQALPSVTELADTLETLRAELDLPGLRAAIRTDDALVEAATGWSDVEARIPLDTTMGMPGGSTGKTFVAATAMRLVERDIIEVSDPISLYVGDQGWYRRIAGAENITIEHLLTHTAGVPDHVDDLDFALSMVWRRLTSRGNLYSPRELIAFVEDNGLLFEPGTAYTYTDTGYLMLGLVLEAAAVQPYYEMLRELILEPHDIEARPALSDAMPNVSPGYVDTTLLTLLGGLAGKTIENGRMRLHPLTEWTGGGLTTTPQALADFYHKLANGMIVSAETFSRMRQGGYKDATRNNHYGYGLFVDDERVGHGGWFPGYSTSARHYDAAGNVDDLTIAVQANNDREFSHGRIQQALYALVAAQAPR